MTSLSDKLLETAGEDPAPAASAPAPANEQKIRPRVLKITPRAAEKLLERNTHNRSVRAAAVTQYATDMRNGDWQFNGEAIKIADTGEILDGQHRLMAILEADIPVTMLLITGLPAVTQETMDQGRGRTFGDMLKLRGERNPNELAAATRIVFLYQRDGVPFHTGFRGPAPSAQLLSRCLEHNGDLRDSVALATSQKRTWLQASIVAAFHFLFAVASQEDADDFFNRLLDGTGLEASDPRYVLREKLIRERYENGWMAQKPRMALTIKAWNHYRAGDEISRLSWAPGGVNGEKFPTIDGLEIRGGGPMLETPSDAPQPAQTDEELAEEIYAVCHEKPVTAEVLAKTRDTTVHRVTRLLEQLETEGRVSHLEDGSWCA